MYVWLVCFKGFHRLSTKKYGDEGSWIDNWAVNAFSKKRLNVTDAIFDQLDDLYEQAKTIYNTWRRKGREEELVTQLDAPLAQYRNLRICEIRLALEEKISSKFDRTYFRDKAKSVVNLWIDVDDLFYDLSRDKRSALAVKIDSAMREVDQKRKELAAALDCYLDPMLSEKQYKDVDSVVLTFLN